MSGFVYKNLKKALEGDDDAITALLSRGKVENFSENDRGMITNCMIFTDKDDNTFTYSVYSIDKTKFNTLVQNKENTQTPLFKNVQNSDLGEVKLKHGASFYARTYDDALVALNIIKEQYEGMIDTLVSNEEYSRLTKVKEGIEELEEKIEYYRQKQRKGPEGGQIQMGSV